MGFVKNLAEFVEDCLYEGGIVTAARAWDDGYMYATGQPPPERENPHRSSSIFIER
jgi:hypothetical protein